jgi:GNAT superfamily N-acetyltransferase
MVAEQWWRAVIAAPAAETLVFECGGLVHGFCVLVTDANLWAAQHACRRTSPLQAVLSVLACPHVVLAKVREKIAAERPAAPRSIERGDGPNGSARTWIELIAVGPDMRGRGVAQMLLQACEARTAELGGGTIGLSVDAGNGPAIRLYEAAGYARTSATKSRCIYVKTLSANDQKAKRSADVAGRRINLGNPVQGGT